MEFKLAPFHRNIPSEDFLDDLRRVARALDGSEVTWKKYLELGRFNPQTLRTRFGSWNGALDRAGLDRARTTNNSIESLFRNLVDVWTLVGHQPRREDMERGKISGSTYEHRFGTWRKALEAFVIWANEGQLPPELDGNSKRLGKRTPRAINWRLRALVLMRDGAVCQMCGAKPSDGIRLHVDHIFPWIKGGETVLDNLQILCEKCNIGKSDIDPTHVMNS